MNRVYLTGDTHGEWMERFNRKMFPEQKELTKADYMIILGDFGIWDRSKRENHALDWLEEKPFTTLFISGNHENYDILDDLPIEEWHGGKVNFIRPSVIHLRRGQIFEIAHKRFWTFGGASSHDITHGILELDDPEYKAKKRRLDNDPFALYRVNHRSWWERELPNSSEMNEGIGNLGSHNFKTDYMLTHTIYEDLRAVLDGGSEKWPTDILTQYLQKIKKLTAYEHWFFGHFHYNQTLADEKATCLYKEIRRLI